jgi:hypothetical protein
MYASEKATNRTGTYADREKQIKTNLLLYIKSVPNDFFKIFYSFVYNYKVINFSK